MLPIYCSMHALPYNKHLLVSLLWNANALKVVAYFICLRISEPSAFKEFCLYSLNQWFCLVEMNCHGHTYSGLCEWQGMVMEVSFLSPLVVIFCPWLDSVFFQIIFFLQLLFSLSLALLFLDISSTITSQRLHWPPWIFQIPLSVFFSLAVTWPSDEFCICKII